MAKPNYSYQKFQKEQKRKKKQEEKRLRRQQKSPAAGEAETGPSPDQQDRSQQ